MSSDATKIQSNVAASVEKDAERSIAGANAQWQQTRAVDAPYVTLDGAHHMLLKPGQLWLDSSGKGVEVNYAATIRIQVRELQGQDLGLLNLPPDDKSTLERVKAQAMSRKLSEDTQWHGIDHQSARDPQKNAYFGSPSHVVWSEAASLRSGGRLDAEWMRNFDPYGGTNASGPNIAPDEMYPSAASKIGMAHKTDWNLGRFFNAGPLESLYDSSVSQPQLGLYGLTYRSTVEPAPRDLYTSDGHPDWKVEYVKNPILMRSDPETAEPAKVASSLGFADGIYARPSPDFFRTAQPSIGDDGSAKVTLDSPMPYAIASRDRNLDPNDAPTLAPENARFKKHFEQALKGTGGDNDMAAVAVYTISQAPGFKPDQDISVVQGKNGLIVSQGEGAASLNLPIPEAKLGAFDKIAAHMAQPQQVQQVAMQPDSSLEQRSKAPTL
jgi:hypothetical protein